MDSTFGPMDDPQAELLVSHAHRPGRFNMDVRHFHARHEIYYLRQGERNYFIRDRVYHIVAGDVVLIAANELHKTSSRGREGHERLLVEFAPSFLVGTIGPELDDLLALFAGTPLILKPGAGERQALEELFSRLLAEFRGRQFHQGPMTRLLVGELLVSLNRLARASLVTASQPSDPLHQTISEVTIYINLHYQTALSLTAVAKLFLISPSHLSRNFARVTGFHFAAYIASVRVREARHLLVATDWPIARVAESSGFASATSFGRLFLSQTGVSPLRYRKLHGHPAV